MVELRFERDFIDSAMDWLCLPKIPVKPIKGRASMMG